MPEKPNQFRSLIAASGQGAVTDPEPATSAQPASAPLHATTVVTSVRRPGKRSAPDYTQVGAYIPKRLHNQVKMKLLQEGDSLNFSELIEGLLSAYVANRKN